MNRLSQVLTVSSASGILTAMGRASQERRKRRDSAAPGDEAGKSPWLYIAAGAAVIVVAALAAKLLVRTQVEWKAGSPAWSPDGRRIAFYSERDGNAEIYVMSADGSNARPLTKQFRSFWRFSISGVM